MLRLPWLAMRVEPLLLQAGGSGGLTSLTQRRGRRRTTTPPVHLPPVHEAKLKNTGLDDENVALLEKVHAAEKAALLSTLPEKAREPDGQRIGTLEEYSQRRVGLLVQKIGMLPQWMTNGSRILCTMLHVPANHVVSVTSPEQWYRRSVVGKRKAYNRGGPWHKVTVGAEDTEPWHYTAAYRAQFAKVGIPVKKRIASFIVSEDALPVAGQPLDARHFVCGQHVTATGKTIDWGFQGGMHRWGMRGQPKNNTTKSHRRIGSIGSTGDARVWPGKRMPGHMGWEWVTLSGIQIVRMNIDKQVIYVKGNVPGDMGEWLLLKDCVQEAKRPKDIPLPTWTPSLETIAEEKEEEGKEKQQPAIHTDSETFIEKLFRFTSPSLLFTAEDAKRTATRDKTKAKIAKVKK